MIKPLVSLALSAAATLFSAVAADAVELKAAVFRVDYRTQAPISRFDERPADFAFAGAQLATQDNATTGQFLGHTFELATVATDVDGIAATLAGLRADGVNIIVVNARADEVLKVADAAPDTLVFNAGASQTRLRQAECRANLLHTTPSDAMRADAVAQFSSWKKWSRWFLVHGSNPADRQLADEYRRAATKFGLKIVEEREILDTGGSRRADTGHVQVQRQIPVLLQDAKRHDMVVAADASDVFAPYLPFHLWDPRPVLGSGGLRPVSFNPATESWGGTQFQSRFEKLAGRYVTEADYDAWVALRAVGEAVVRTGSADVQTLRRFMLSDEFELAAFKGQPVTFRNWNGQLRQPVLLYDGRINASVSPQEGFLHQFSLLDSLGMDAPETKCTAFEGDN
ncbi:MAG: ABC transporter substrate-binding protein [Rhodobacteraceae bacterium]|nr:ABC transporter substrate-binding protein [Paracoccaceae bacterium]